MQAATLERCTAWLWVLLAGLHPPSQGVRAMRGVVFVRLSWTEERQ
jgi:hypothetical protein